VIVVELCGGLGNQLFQYAAARTVADRLGTDLGLDLRPLLAAGSRPYGLGHFNIRATVLSVRDLPPRYLAPHGWRWSLTRGLVDRVRAAIRRPALRHLRPVVYQGSAFRDVLAGVTDDSWLEGFWQSERYFAEGAERLRADLTLKALTPATARLQRHIESLACPVAVHVRRGDYAAVASTRAHHGLCSLEYYRAAIARVRDRHPEATFVLFSDDPDWVAANLRVTPACLVTANGEARPHEDLHLMSRCRAHVIANSSFSWWGAWLARSELVIAPRQWYRSPAADGSDVVPARWLRL
jgi:hypothetical protein